MKKLSSKVTNKEVKSNKLKKKTLDVLDENIY